MAHTNLFLAFARTHDAERTAGTQACTHGPIMSSVGTVFAALLYRFCFLSTVYMILVWKTNLQCSRVHSHQSWTVRAAASFYATVSVVRGDGDLQHVHKN